MSAPRVSALVRCRDEVAGIGALLDSLAAQTVPVEVVVIDSGSRDGTLAAIAARGLEPLRIALEDFSYGRALNRAAAAAAGDVLVAISAHALPPDRAWVARMADAVHGERVACAAGARVDPELRPLRAAILQDRAHAERHPLYGYSNAAGAFRRALWEERPFDEDLAAAEDREWAWHWLQRGWRVRLDPALAVAHSHADEGPRRTFRRARADHAAQASFRTLAPYGARGALREWWTGPHAHRSAVRARLDPRRVATIAGKWAGLRSAR